MVVSKFTWITIIKYHIILAFLRSLPVSKDVLKKWVRDSKNKTEWWCSLLYVILVDQIVPSKVIYKTTRNGIHFIRERE